MCFFMLLVVIECNMIYVFLCPASKIRIEHNCLCDIQQVDVRNLVNNGRQRRDDKFRSAKLFSAQAEGDLNK